MLNNVFWIRSTGEWVKSGHNYFDCAFVICTFYIPRCSCVPSQIHHCSLWDIMLDPWNAKWVMIIKFYSSTVRIVSFESDTWWMQYVCQAISTTSVEFEFLTCRALFNAWCFMARKRINFLRWFRTSTIVSGAGLNRWPLRLCWKRLDIDLFEPFLVKTSATTIDGSLFNRAYV